MTKKVKEIIKYMKEYNDFLLREENLTENTMFISNYQGNGGPCFLPPIWYWSADLKYFAIAYKESIMREYVVNAIKFIHKDFNELYEESLKYPVSDYVKHLKNDCPDIEEMFVYDRLVWYFDDFDKKVNNKNFNIDVFRDLLAEFDKLANELICCSETELYNGVGELVAMLKDNYPDLYNEILTGYDDEPYDLEILSDIISEWC